MVTECEDGWFRSASEVLHFEMKLIVTLELNCVLGTVLKYIVFTILNKFHCNSKKEKLREPQGTCHLPVWLTEGNQASLQRIDKTRKAAMYSISCFVVTYYFICYYL